ncbi:MAG: hypothetical protein M1821_003986 [Bathelium mastoideum]|nr:MAG: hypothetical protein M1821_003986 [Bathelium mastoideum]
MALLAEIKFAQRSTPEDLLNLIIEMASSEADLMSFGSFSVTVYDTAWLAMLRRRENPNDWLFPESFEFLLQTQQKDGTWPSYASPFDGILNTLAALLAMLIHKRTRLLRCSEAMMLSSLIQKAQDGLHVLLQTWDVERTEHVGFEILVPSLLRQLQSFKINFQFPGYKKLLYLEEQKLQKFKPKAVGSEVQTTVLHSLEALVGLINFDSVRQHCTEETGILGSPAATAAYLLNASEWDEKAERYLKKVVDVSNSSGAVPSAFPTSIFEISWALSTLLMHSSESMALNRVKLGHLSEQLSQTLERHDGAVGFAPGILADADDTARVLFTLELLGKNVDFAGLIDRFESSSCFKTYEVEQKPSFSANCNVLLALLESDIVQQYSSKAENILTFLLEQWRHGGIRDKWNLSSAYSFMLLAHALVRTVERWEACYLDQLPMNMVCQEIPLTLCQILAWTLSNQQDNGSWADSIEVTAYNILTLVECLRLPWHHEIKDLVERRISEGRDFMSRQPEQARSQEFWWIEKVTYQSLLLQKSFYIAAIHAPYETLCWSTRVLKLYSELCKGSQQLQSLLKGLPLFQKAPLQSIPLAMLEAQQYSGYLDREKSKIFPRDQMPMTEDKYLRFISVLWTACNQTSKSILPPDVLWNMIFLSMLNFQMDEYMESVVLHLTEPCLRILVLIIAEKCGLQNMQGQSTASKLSGLDQADWPKCDLSTGNSFTHADGDLGGLVSLESVTDVIGSYIKHVIQHIAVIQSPESIRKSLAYELNNFLLAHISHNLENRRLRIPSQSNVNLQDGFSYKRDSCPAPEFDYFRWVRSIGADDTSCPFSFQFFVCLISPPGASCFQGARANYLSRSLARHLATMCRQYNDCGSALRDIEESNLNSLHFTEFQPRGARKSIDDTADPCNGLKDECLKGQETSNVNGDSGGKANIDISAQDLPAKSNAKVTAKEFAIEEESKRELLEIAEFERSCVHLAVQNLERVGASPDTLKAVRMFVDLTDLFGQVYVTKDIASRVKA